MISVGGLSLEKTSGGDVQVEILPDDFPTRYPFLEEPKSQRITGERYGEDVYGQLTWRGLPRVDAKVDVEVVASGNKVARFQWSEDDGENFVESKIVVPLGGSHELGDTGLTANFAASPAPEAETEYTFTGTGTASKSGTGPDLEITGSGSIDGIIQIQTGVGSLRYRINDGVWSAALSMESLPIDLPGLDVSLDVAPEEDLALLLEAGSRFDFTALGFFHLKLTRGSTVELYERLRVGSELWMVSSTTPASRRSQLLSSASWTGTERPVVGSYSL